jgi:hypothetical protein
MADAQAEARVAIRLTDEQLRRLKPKFLGDGEFV